VTDNEKQELGSGDCAVENEMKKTKPGCCRAFL